MKMESRPATWIRRLSIIIAGVLVLMLVSWILQDPRENLATDWTAFDRAADRVLNGEAVYRPFAAGSESLPYLYPPFALWLALPLAAFGFFGSFLFSLLLTLGAMVAGVVLLLRLADPLEVDTRVAFTVVVTCGATISSSLIGQYSGLYVLALAGGAYLIVNQRHAAAGALLALLWLKPNLALAVPVVLVWSKSWKELRAFGLASMGVFAASLPFGLSQWQGFMDNARMMAELQRDDIVPLHKMITVQSTIQRVTGLSSNDPVLWAAWLAVVVVTGVAVLQLWRPAALAFSVPRAIGGLALFLVAANPRLYFYDGVLVAFGCLCWWVSRDPDGIGPSARLGWALVAVMWVAMWGGLWTSLNVLTGPMAAGLLIVMALSSRTGALPDIPIVRPSIPVGVGRSAR